MTEIVFSRQQRLAVHGLTARWDSGHAVALAAPQSESIAVRTDPDDGRRWVITAQGRVHTVVPTRRMPVKGEAR